MTHRLYYTDPYLQAFDAAVQRVETRGDRTVVVLDRTAFYPTSGGQPFDTGSLGGIAVVDVVDEDDGTIAHVIDLTHGGQVGREGQEGREGPARQDARAEGLAPGTTIRGVIDWPRRFDHMQQHTGQHVLSAAFDMLFSVRTVSFHLGAEASTIDLARVVSPSEIAAAELEANRVVWEDRPVTIRFADAEEAARLPLRKEPARGGTLRLIDVERFDLSACGGTHVARTGSIGVIAVAASERFKGGQRIEFFCGARVLRRFHALRDSVTASVRALSVLPEEIPSAIGRLQGDAKEQKRALSVLQSELARYRAVELAAAAEPTQIGRVVCRSLDADAGGLKSLAMAITETPGYVVVLVSASRPALVVVARSSDRAVASQEIVGAVTARLGGRGGGKPELAQAGGIDADPAVVLSAARDAVNQLARP